MMKKLLTLLLLYGALVFVLTGVCFGADYVYNFTPWDNDLDDLDHSAAYSWEINMTGAVDSTNAVSYKPDQVITSMVLTFDDIYDNSNDYNNKIYLSVLVSAGEEGGKIKDWDGLGSYEEDRFIRNGDVDYYHDNRSGYVNYFTNDLNNGAVSQLNVIENVVTQKTKRNDIDVTFTPGVNDTSGTVTIVDKAASTTTTVSSSGVKDLFEWARDGVFELGFDPDCHFYNRGISLMVYTSESTGASHAPEPETLVLFGLGLLGASAFGRKRFS
ncbi:PEP-CTERM sorting domain-containing protein [Desulfobacter postgatei]|uniref:PEP-CTERM putative exosortase interaction domain-containing protein n=1 Tax=Desulfobacter postgatei 2ac9 TaxID=879212 RepID=I5B358_9BACT|nr:PEP-CTERM sorting domain-containing protein [Desulfobacter postgatei]EIM63921.1 PEP-CTERM putative exosortase interaction domain-containing protein [Desulfobacter postgatei 2ac9]